MRKVLVILSCVIGLALFAALGGYLGVLVTDWMKPAEWTGDGMRLLSGGMFGIVVGAFVGVVALIWLSEKWAAWRDRHTGASPGSTGSPDAQA